MRELQLDLEKLGVCLSDEQIRRVANHHYMVVRADLAEAKRKAQGKVTYTLCKHCDHFVDPNEPLDTAPPGTDQFIHLEDGEQEFDHRAEPSDQTHTLDEWKRLRPDLFQEHPDGKIGPNSKHHSRRGKDDGQ